MSNEAKVSALWARLGNAEKYYNEARTMIQDMREPRIIEANASTYNPQLDMARSRPYFETIAEKSREMYEISEELRLLTGMDAN